MTRFQNLVSVSGILTVTALAAGTAQADQHSLTRCQATARSTVDNSNCYDVEIKSLERRLPRGSATVAWEAQRDQKCNKQGDDEAQGGSAGAGITQACRLDATRARLHLPTS